LGVDGQIDNVIMTCHGHGYLVPPKITVTPAPPGGTTAVLSAILQKDAGVDAFTGACLPNVNYPRLATIDYAPFSEGVPPSATPLAIQPYLLPAPYPLPLAAMGGEAVIRLAQVEPDSVDGSQPILGVNYRIKGRVDKVWNELNDSIRLDTSMQYLYLFTINESDSGVSFGFPYDPERCGPGQILIPTPWDKDCDYRLADAALFQGGGVVQTRQGGTFPGQKNDSGIVPNHYAIINLNGKGSYGMAVDVDDGSNERSDGDGVPVDASISIDCTKGQDGSGFWPYAISCSDGTACTGKRGSLATMNQAITDPLGWDMWNRAAQKEFKPYKPYNIEKSHLYAMVISASIAGGPSEPEFPGPAAYDWALSAWDLSNLTVEVDQLRYQPEANDRIATLIASNQGAQQFGIQCDVNVLSIPKDDEIQAFPVPGFDVKTEDLCETTRSMPNARVGEVISRR
jgi:hypothetical protein